VTAVVEQALEAGFSHIDTASYYANEQFVCIAIRESGLPREDVWVTSKYERFDNDVQGAVRTSLHKLGLAHLDLYLVHSPESIVNDDVEGLWGRMVDIREAGLAKSIGVSNFKLDLLQRIVKMGKRLPAVNQIELHPYNYASWKDVLEFSAKHGIITEAYSSLAPITKYYGGALDPVLATIAQRIGGTPGQVLFKWAHAKGFVVVTTTERRTRLDEYLAVFHLPDLTPDEIEAIDKAGVKGPPLVRVEFGFSCILTLPQTLVPSRRKRRVARGAMSILLVVLFWRWLGWPGLAWAH